MESIFKNKLIILLFLIIIIGFGSFLLIKRKNQEKKVSFKTEKPFQQDITQYVNATGSLQAKEQITIGSLIAGKVEKIIADDNDVVKKDQVLAILDDGIGDSAIKSLKAILLEANANLKYQQAFYNRQKKLYESNQISKNLFEDIEKNYEIAKAKVLQADAQLEIRTKEYNNLFIKAPKDGIVISKQIDLGQMITSRLQATVLYVMAKDLHKMEADVAVDEADIGLIKDGQEAVFTVDAFPNEVFKAKIKLVQYLAKIVDNVVTYGTILNVDNQNLKLRPGMTTNVNIKVLDVKDALVVHNRTLRINKTFLKKTAKELDYDIEKLPKKTDTISKAETPSVWIVQNNLFKEVEVKTGAIEGQYTQIISGLNKNNNVVTEVTDFSDKTKFLLQMFKPTGSGGIGK